VDLERAPLDKRLAATCLVAEVRTGQYHIEYDVRSDVRRSDTREKEQTARWHGSWHAD
jgi:hypothetical protein